MTIKQISLFLGLALLFSACKSAQQKMSLDKPDNWYHLAMADDFEIYIDTTSIKRENNLTYVREKKVFLTAESKKKYIDNIEKRYIKMGKPEKIDKWKDFSYCIYNSIYECANRRSRIISVEDYDSTGKLILKTMPSSKPLKWKDFDVDTVEDYTYYFICDYQR